MDFATIRLVRKGRTFKWPEFGTSQVRKPLIFCSFPISLYVGRPGNKAGVRRAPALAPIMLALRVLRLERLERLGTQWNAARLPVLRRHTADSEPLRLEINVFPEMAQLAAS
jgi:hypothetical protein